MSDNTIKVRLKSAYKTEAQWTSSNPVLLSGEVCYSSDKPGWFKVGNGSSTWTQLSYNQVPWSSVSGRPSSLKNPNALTLQFKGVTNKVYDGSSAQTVNITPESIGALASTGGTISGPLTINGVVNLNRKDNINRGRMSWYSPSFYTWFDYMSDPSSDACPTGGTPSVKGNVTSWAKRSLIENNSGYGWIWESCANSSGANPTTMMALSSKEGHLYLKGRLQADAGITSSGRLYANGAITLPTVGSSWINGMTTVSTSGGILATGNSTGSYHPIIRYEMNSGNQANLGAIRDYFGFWGYKSGRTENGTDCYAYLDVANSYFTATKFYGPLQGNATSADRANKWTTARTLTLTGSVTGSVSMDGSGNVSLATTTNHTHSYLPLSGGTLTNNISYNMHGTTRIPLKVYGGDSNGQGISIGAGGATIVGSGESAKACESLLAGHLEQLWITSDQDIHFFTGCATIGNRVGVILNATRSFYPNVNNTGTLGTSSYKWSNVYATTFTGNLTGTATKATQDGSGNVITSKYVTVDTTQNISGVKTFTNTTASTSKTTGALKVSGGVGISGQMSSNSVQIADKVKLEYNSTTESLDFIFV